MNVKEKVFEIVASVCETEVSNVNENSTIGDFPQWDSMGHLTILSNVEEAFDINFEPEEMMDLEDEKLLEFVQDYRIFLIDPYKLTDNDLEKFSSSLGDVLGYIKYSKDKNALLKFLNDSQVMIMDNDAARVIRDITNTPIYVPDGKGEIDMCKAVKDLMDESKTEGIAEGIAEGIKKMALKMYKNGDSIEKIAETAEVSINQVKEWINSTV